MALYDTLFAMMDLQVCITFLPTSEPWLQKDTVQLQQCPTPSSLRKQVLNSERGSRAFSESARCNVWALKSCRAHTWPCRIESPSLLTVAFLQWNCRAAHCTLQASQLLVTPRDFRDPNFKVNLREHEELLSVSPHPGVQ